MTVRVVLAALGLVERSVPGPPIEIARLCASAHESRRRRTRSRAETGAHTIDDRLSNDRGLYGGTHRSTVCGGTLPGYP